MDMTRTAQRALAALDLTSLNEDDTPSVISALCARAHTRFGSVAAVCVYPEHVALAREYLQRGGGDVRVATVVNFPDGAPDPARAVGDLQPVILAI